MSVIEVNELSAEGGETSKGGRQYTVQYQVKTDSREDGPLTVIDSPLLPSQLDVFSFHGDVDFGAFRTSITAKPVKKEGSLKLWVVTAQFQTAGLGGSNLSQIDQSRVADPTQTPPEISGSFSLINSEAYFDSAGDPILNSAKGRLPTGQPKIEVPITILAIKKYYSVISLSTLGSFIGSTNSSPFFGLEAGRWMLKQAPWQQIYGAGYVPYYMVSYEFAALYGGQTWQIKVLDEGTRDKNNALPTDTRGVAINGVAGLDGAGNFVAANTNPATLTFDVYPSKDFSLLGIPTSI